MLIDRLIEENGWSVEQSNIKEKRKLVRQAMVEWVSNSAESKYEAIAETKDDDEDDQNYEERF